MDNFELLTRKKARFATSRGHISLEQLWDVPVTSSDGFTLEAIAAGLTKEIAAAGGTSILGGEDKSKKAAKALLEAQLEAVKRVYEVKIEEADKVRTRAANKAKRQKLLEALAAREEGDMAKKTQKQLLAELEAIDEMDDE